MAGYSKNTGSWRTSANGNLNAHRTTSAKIGEAHGRPIDGRLDLSTVQHGGNRRSKRVKQIATTRNETRMVHHSARTGKNARKRAQRQENHLTGLAVALMLAIAQED
jgi:hypothetical protein